MKKLDRKMGELWEKSGLVRVKMTRNCKEWPKFWVRVKKSTELASKFAWVRSKIGSELDPQKRKNNPGYLLFIVKTYLICRTVLCQSLGQTLLLTSQSRSLRHWMSMGRLSSIAVVGPIDNFRYLVTTTSFTSRQKDTWHLSVCQMGKQ